MNIKYAAEQSGISTKMIRYYEEIGLITGIARTESGYRDYYERDISKLQFIYQARQLGFSLERIKSLLILWQDQDRHSADVKHIASEHLIELETKILQMQQMVDVLQRLIQQCAGNDDSSCPILQSFQS